MSHTASSHLPVKLQHRRARLRPLLACTTALGGALVLSALGTTPVAAQATQNWSGAASNDYAATGNWTSGNVADAAGEEAQFQNGATRTAVTVGSNVATDAWRFFGATGYTVSGPGVVTLNTTLQYGSTASGQIGTVIAGAGGLFQNNTGTLTLSAANTFTGNVFVNSGILDITGSVASLSVSGTSGGTIRVHGASISDLAAVNLGSSGNLTLAASETIGSLASNTMATASVVLGANTLTTGGNGDSTSFTGTISGTGGLTKVGTGTFTLIGTNTYSGATTLSGGTLAVGSSAALGDASATNTLVMDGGVLKVANGFDMAATRGVTLNAAGGTVDTNGSSLNIDGAVSGTGGLTKTGLGTLRLRGNSSYGGATRIEAGTLQVINGTGIGDASAVTLLNVSGARLRVSTSETIGSLAGGGSSGGNVSIENSSVLTTGGDNSSTTFGGVVSGSGGAIVKTGTGTMILTGDNTYSGGTTISGGTLQIGDGGTAGSIAGAVTNNAALAFDRSDDTTFSDVVSGTGSVTKFGDGILTFTGENTYAGGTTISAGTLRIGDGNTYGSIAGNVVDNAALTFDRSDSTGFAGSISGTGSVTKLGDGTLTLTGTNSYFGGTTISAGTLQVGDGGTAGSLQGSVENEGALVFNRADASSFTGAISGTGRLTKSGTGTLTLSGNNTYSGTTQIDDGIVTVSGGNGIGDDSAVTLANAAGAVLAVSTSETIGSLSGGGAAGGNITLGSFNFLPGIPGFPGFPGLPGPSSTATLTAGGNNASTTYGGQIGDFIFFSPGSFTKVGTGTQTFTGTNTYSGGTTISGGTLQIGDGGTTGSIAGNVVDNANLTFSRSDDMGFAGAISGTGSLTKLGANTLTLTGANGYAGGTTISGGTLQIGNGGTAGSITGDVANEGTLAFNRSDDTGFAGNVAGAGGLVKLGAGSLTLSGNNTYSGATRIDAGTVLAFGGNAIGDESALTLADVAGAGLAIGDSETIASLSGGGAAGGNISIGGNVFAPAFVLLATSPQPVVLTVGGDDASTTYGGQISGLSGSAAGGFAKVGEGTLTLTGANTYSGGTTISGGTLRIGDGGTTGSIAGDVVNDATLAFDRSDEASFAGAISGTGRLVKSGAGTLILTGASSYGGGTEVLAGTLSGGTASIRGDIANAGTVVLDEGVDATLATDVAGLEGADGQMVKRGAGTLTLAGMSNLDWTVEAGGLVSASDRFTGDLALAAESSFIFDQTYEGTYAGQITGDGEFGVIGGGLVKLTGDSSAYAGTAEIAGDLSVNGTLGGELQILSGGRLMGNGTVGDTELASGATIAPGNSVGTLSVAGDLAFASGSSYEVEIGSDGTSDLIEVSGTASLNDAGLDIAMLDPTVSYQNGQTYTLLTAGTVDGRFGAPTGIDSAFLASTVNYSATGVSLELKAAAPVDPTTPTPPTLPPTPPAPPTPVPTPLFSTVAETANQRSTATALDGLDQTEGSADLALYNAILFSNASEARTAFDQLSGEVHSSVETGLIEESRHVRGAMADRMTAAFSAPGVASTTSGPNEGGAVPAGGGLEAWIDAYGSWGETDGDGNAASIDRDTGGFLVGADGFVSDDARIGFLAGYSQSSIDLDARSSSADIDSYHVGVYGGTKIGDVGLKAGAAYSWNEIDTARSVDFPGFSDSLEASYDSGTAQVFGEASYQFDLGTATVEPFANLAYVALDTDRFGESGGAAALTSGGDHADATFSTLGLRGSAVLPLGTMEVTASGMVGWRHAYGDTTPETTLAFDSGSVFSVAGAPIVEDAALLELGLGVDLAPNANLGVHYSGQFGGDATDNGVTARFAVRF